MTVIREGRQHSHAEPGCSLATVGLLIFIVLIWLRIVGVLTDWPAWRAWHHQLARLWDVL